MKECTIVCFEYLRYKLPQLSVNAVFPLPKSAARHVRCVNKMRKHRKCAVQLPQYRSEEKERRVGTAELSCDRSGGATGKPLNHSLLFFPSIVSALRSTWRVQRVTRFDATQTSTGVLVWVEPTIPPYRHEGIQGTCAMLTKCRRIGWPSGSSHCEDTESLLYARLAHHERCSPCHWYQFLILRTTATKIIIGERKLCLVWGNEITLRYQQHKIRSKPAHLNIRPFHTPE